MWFATGGPGPEGDFVWIMYAESEDGDDWEVQREPALEPGTAKNSWDYTNTETPSVIIDPGAPATRRYVLFYSGGNKLEAQINEFPYYSIGVAFSADGRRFTRLPSGESRHGKAGLLLTAHDLFPDVRFKEGIVSDPVAVWRDGLLHLWFSAVTLRGSGPQINGIGYATSRDGLTWKPHGKQVLAELGIPFVLLNPRTNQFELWANLDEPERVNVLPERDVLDLGTTLRYRHYLSADGIRWKRNEGKDVVYDPAHLSEVCGLTAGPAAILRDSGPNHWYEMFYGAWGKKGVPDGSSVACVWAINRATLAQ